MILFFLSSLCRDRQAYHQDDQEKEKLFHNAFTFFSGYPLSRPSFTLCQCIISFKAIKMIRDYRLHDFAQRIWYGNSCIFIYSRLIFKDCFICYQYPLITGPQQQMSSTIQPVFPLTGSRLSPSALGLSLGLI